MSQTNTPYRSRCAGTCLFALLAGIQVAAGQLVVETDFEGASAKVVAIEQQERTIRFEPGGDPSGGWPSWWNFRIRGARPGEPITLRLRAPKTVIPQTTLHVVEGQAAGFGLVGSEAGRLVGRWRVLATDRARCTRW